MVLLVFSDSVANENSAMARYVVSITSIFKEGVTS